MALSLITGLRRLFEVLRDLPRKMSRLILRPALDEATPIIAQGIPKHIPRRVVPLDNRPDEVATEIIVPARAARFKTEELLENAIQDNKTAFTHKVAQGIASRMIRLDDKTPPR